ncbi:FAD-dependent oxidoreductase [Haliangium sp. UPWRP_2]|uniref:FAD-dependent oxidoreductase n=1 Tax=Haliangium sp. UPWRP_2 TaxID=1931276 RepID=UPI001E43A0E9|nr:FAD-dependent oxidoreductase [Haliangium sp. UPWRP_2]
MEVPSAPKKVFVLGSFERRVTLWAQQNRALNLGYALHHEGLLTVGTKAAVIGGGVAGLTVAAALEQKGGHVTLFEQQAQLLPLLQGNHTRWIHPRIYDWPAPGSESADAGLPLLNWEAALAGQVAEQILQGFQRAATGCKILTGVSDLTVVPGSEPKQLLTWRGGEARFDIVILAMGFGLERTMSPLPLVSYWRDDSLHQPELSSGVRAYLVSGCGDGGLTDLLRLRLTRFRHEHLVRDLFRGTPLEPLKARLLEIEQDLPRQHEDARPAWLTEQYRTLPVPPSLDENLRSRLRHDTRATLNGTGAFALDASSSVLNRFLAWRLLSYGDVAYESGRVSSITAVEPGYEVHFSSGRQLRFDHVVLRHGPVPAIRGFSIVEPHLDEFRSRAALDQTRARIWPDSFYRVVSARSSMPLTPPSTVNPGASGRRISAVFSTRGIPNHNFVTPPRFSKLKDRLKANGRGLIVEGPSGIGKTVAVRKALQSLQPVPPVIWLKGYDSRDRLRLGAVLDTPFTGHLVVDDVLQLQSSDRTRLVEEILRIYDDNERDAKITLIDDSGTGERLTVEFSELHNCIEVFPLQRHSDEDIGKLIYDGQQESNLRFARPEQLVRAARGSCFIAQQLCEKAASIKEISMAPADVIEVEIEMEVLIEEMMLELQPRYQPRLLNFAAIDRAAAHPGACLALLVLLARSPNDRLSLTEAQSEYPGFAATFAWLRQGALANGVRDLRGLMTYDTQPEILTLQDPRLGFYLQHLAWVEFAHQMGRRIGLGPNGVLSFP